LLTFLGRMPFLVPTLDNADPLCALVLILGFYLHRVEVGQIKTQLVVVNSQNCNL